MKPKVSITAKEVELRSSDFLCEVIIDNVDDKEIFIKNISYNLPAGVKANEAKNSDLAVFDRSYDEICKSLSIQITDHIISVNAEKLRGSTSGISKAIGRRLGFFDILDIYFAFIVGKTPRILEDYGSRQFKIKIESLADAHEAVRNFDITPNENMNIRRILFDVARLGLLKGDAADIKTTITIQPKSSQKIYYVFSAKRNPFSGRAFAIPFNIISEQVAPSVQTTLSTETVAINVAPNIFSLLALSATTAVVGALVSALAQAQKDIEDLTDAKKQGLPIWTGIQKVDWQIWGMQNELPVIGVIMGILTSIIVVGIYDTTSLRVDEKYSYGWRMAMLLGFISGFLNEKVLSALTALVK